MADAGIDRFRLSDAFVHPEEITHALKDLRKCLQGEQIDIPEGYDDSLYARKSGRTKEEA
jgi:hypothetical protein